MRLALEGKTVVRLKGGDPVHLRPRAARRRRRWPPPASPSRSSPGSPRRSPRRRTRGFPSPTALHSSAVVLLTGPRGPGEAGLRRPLGGLRQAQGHPLHLHGRENLADIARRLRGRRPRGLDAGGDRAVGDDRASTAGSSGRWGRSPDSPPARAIEAPAMIIIGEVAAFSEKLAWFEAGRQPGGCAR